MRLYILGMITYPPLYTCSHKLSMIKYYIFSDRLIFITQGFHSDYNCLINHNISILNKTGYKNTNPNSDYFYCCGLH